MYVSGTYISVRISVLSDDVHLTERDDQKNVKPLININVSQLGRFLNDAL